MASSAANCELENGILGFLSNLCRREPFRGLDPVDMKSNVSASFSKRRKERYNQKATHMYGLSQGGGIPCEKFGDARRKT